MTFLLKYVDLAIKTKVLPQIAMLNAARKARVQHFLDADQALARAAVDSKRYDGPTEKQQPTHSDDLIHGLIAAVARERFPALDQPDSFMRCLYSNNLHEMVTGTHEYIVGRHPECADCVVATGFSGDGFKFGIFIGELSADLALGVESMVPGVATTQAIPSIF